MCVYACVYVRVYMYACMYVYVCKHTCIIVYVCMHNISGGRNVRGLNVLLKMGGVIVRRGGGIVRG